MTEYTLVAAIVLMVTVLLAGVRRMYRHSYAWIGLALFAVLTVVADVLLTRVGVYAHRPQFNAGILIDRMPIEDLFYGIALYLVAVLSWTWPPGRRHAQ